MKPGKYDKYLEILITGLELEELKKQTWQMADAFDLDMRIEEYSGHRPIYFYRWDVDCLLDVLSDVIDDEKEYPQKDSPEHLSVKALYKRLKKEYKRLWRD